VSASPNVYTIEDLRHWEHAAGAVLPAIKFAVIGDPVAHSASPPMHMAALAACGIDYSYVRLHIPPSDLPEAAGLLVRNGFRGANLTIPHKASIIPLLATVEPRATLFGVVNTVAIREGGLHGYNTDGPGLARAIHADFGANLGDLCPLVLGAGGGAGRAIAIQCVIEGCKRITLVNRTQSKAEALAVQLRDIARNLHPNRKIQIECASPESQGLGRNSAESELILQCSSLGMKEGDASPFPAELLTSSHLVYDTIYSRPTRLLEDAQSVGARTSDGLSMLLHQGALAFEIWFPDKEAPLQIMKQALAQAVSR
jgi:shikimate dehydrogenase